MGVEYLWTRKAKFNMQTKHSAIKTDKISRRRAKKIMHKEKIVYKTGQGRKPPKKQNVRNHVQTLFMFLLNYFPIKELREP